MIDEIAEADVEVEELPICFQVPHIRATTEHDHPNLSLTELSPEVKLLCAILEQAIKDATGQRVANEVRYKTNEPQKQARRWFEKADERVLGWGWLAKSLGLSPGIIARVHFEVKIQIPQRLRR